MSILGFLPRYMARIFWTLSEMGAFWYMMNPP